MLKTKTHNLTILFSVWAALVSLIINISIVQSATVSVTATLGPSDITNLTAVDFAPGTGEVVLTWIASPTPNIDIQRLEITGPQGPGINFTTKDLTPFPGSLAPDNYANYFPGTNITGLIPGEVYIFRIVSIAGTLESPGLPPDAQIIFKPGAVNPPPFLLPEPGITPGTSNTLYWNNGGVTDATLECRIIASKTNLYTDPLGEPLGGVGGPGDSGWEDCPDAVDPLDPLTTMVYKYTFDNLISGQIYYYQVQSRSAVDGLSPFSNVERSMQQPILPPPPPLGGGGPVGPGGGGGVIPGVCGNGVLDPVEECDDGNTDDGDGCSASCQDEVAAAVSPAVLACGNGIVDTGEECDDGNLNNEDGCSDTCLVEPEHAVAPALEAVCGNGTVESPEECDDGNIDSGDGCTDTCLIEETVCGNAIVEAPTEECDDGNTTSNDGCSDSCQIEEIVDVVLEIRGAPQYRVTNFKKMAEEVMVTESLVNESLLDLTKTSLIAQTETSAPNALAPATGQTGQTDTRETTTTRTTKELAIIDADPADIFRINNTPNLELYAQLGIYKPIIRNLDVMSIKTDYFGNVSIPVTIVAGKYDFVLNGEAHLSTILRDYEITKETEVIILDFTFNDKFRQITGDPVDSNHVNASDMASVLGSYRSQGININDFNKDLNPIVNALDIAILIWNYQMVGEYLIPPEAVASREAIVPREAMISREAAI